MMIIDGCVHSDIINYQEQQHCQQVEEVKEAIAIVDIPMKLNDDSIVTLRNSDHDLYNAILSTFSFNSQDFPNNGCRKKPRTKNRRRKKYETSIKKAKTNIKKNIKPNSNKYQNHLISHICEANVLVIEDDVGWREHAAEVVLDFEDEEWKLSINVSGIPKYSYKACQFEQYGTTNPHTEAIIWNGGKNWSLEFTDHDEWTLFKDMYKECYNLNTNVSSNLRTILIPGVCLIEDYINDNQDFAVPFTQNPSTYISQTKTEIEMAMDPSCVIYDMDSDDEDYWVSKHKMRNISCQMFEKVVDILEKYAYAKQSDNFLYDEVIKCSSMKDIGPPEAIKSIHEYWFSKRQKKGMALIPQFQVVYSIN